MPRHGNSAAIDPSDEGQADYSGPLLSDFDFAAFSHSALVRMADEVCLQMHLLYLSFAIAVRARAADDAEAVSVCTRGLIGIAGVAAERIHRALKLPGGIEGVLRVLELHPLLNPVGYVCRRGGVQPAARAPVAGPRRRFLDLVVLTGIRAAAAGDRHRGGTAHRGAS